MVKPVNPITGYRIKEGGPTYMQLLNMGIIPNKRRNQTGGFSLFGKKEPHQKAKRDFDAMNDKIDKNWSRYIAGDTGRENMMERIELKKQFNTIAADFTRKERRLDNLKSGAQALRNIQYT